MQGRWRWLVLWSLWAARLVPQRTAPRALPQGHVRGLIAPDGSHELYFGIPYATVTHRFQAPGPVPSWDGVFDAEHEHSRCPQKFGDVVVGHEQCLTANVYVPTRRESDRPLPVMVFVHGGGFKEGSGSRLLYGPQYLVERGVLLVTFNYRVNVLGFLCLRTPDAPGNAGLKDQLAALRWVRRSIAAFGGDPDDVTLFGESAGSASVSAHLVSPASAGLFRRAILQSGSSLAPWTLQRDPLRVARDLAKALGHGEVEDPQRLYNILTNASVSELVAAELPTAEGQLLMVNLPYVPCVERQLDGVEPFLIETPLDSYTRGNYTKVPVIIGTTEEEGYFFVAMETDESLASIRLELSFPADLAIPDSERARETQELQQQYLRGGTVSRQSAAEYSRLVGDTHFWFPARREVELMLAAGGHPVYCYLLRYDGYRNFAKLVSGPRWWFEPGATHADDLFYLFNPPMVPSLFEGRMIDVVSTAWTDFAKNREPWAAAPALQELGTSRVTSLHSHRAARAALWSRLYRLYRAAPATP